ncbi:hypothetical protein ACH5RR_005824 [Cinchona calisaya]|uniref:Uncharacterized protein n=1 Tax=Cinchona calisaya TaxID=153742 RepID=A0ABD3AM95_9GENT
MNRNKLVTTSWMSFCLCSIINSSNTCDITPSETTYFVTTSTSRGTNQIASTMETKKVRPKLKKGLWRPEEDLILKKYIEIHGEGRWQTVSEMSGLMRGGRSCRLRWKNYLRPNIKRGEMSEQEKDLIIRLHKLLGNRWSLIAGRLPGRTDNDVKNYWNTHLNREIPRDKRVQENSRELQVPGSLSISNSKSRPIATKTEVEIRGDDKENSPISSWTEDTKNNSHVESTYSTQHAPLFSDDEPFLPIVDSIIFQAFVNYSDQVLREDVQPFLLQ